MDLLELYRRPNLTTGFLLAVMLAVFRSAFSQPAFDRASNDVQRQLVETISQIETQDGPNSADLIEPLTVLGLSYQEAGDDILAVVAIQRALEVVRINHGLYALEQVALMRQLIVSEEAFGTVEAAWDLEQELLALARRHPDDLRTVPVFREIAQKRMAMLNRYLAGEFVPEVVAGCYYDLALSDSVGSCHSGERSTVFQRIISEVQIHYADAIGVLLRNQLYSSETLRELELELARSSDLIRFRQNDGDRTVKLVEIHGIQHLQPWQSQSETLVQLARWDLDYSLADSMLGERAAADREMALRSYRRQDQYELGRLALSRLVVYAQLGSDLRQDQIHALVQLADWDLLYSRNGLALDEYHQAYELMNLSGLDPQLVEQTFSPEVPVVLPEFDPDFPLSIDGSESNGYIDVSFEVTRFGQSRRIDVIDSSARVTRADRSRLVKQIRRSRFRPRIVDGQIVDSFVVTVRYFVNEVP